MDTLVSTDISLAAQFLERGEIVAIPTETVYGLAANALNPSAIAKVFEAKNRPLFDPLIVHIGNKSQLTVYAKNISSKAQQLAEAFWPGPITLVLQRHLIIPDLATSGLETVGLRMPKHNTALQLLSQIDFPLAAPSANPFGYISPTTSRHVYDQLKGKIPMVLDGGPCEVGVESTIVQCDGEKVTVLRLGGVTVEEIERAVGPVSIQLSAASNPSAPGMFTSHYAPRKPLYIGKVEELISTHSDRNFAILSFHKKFDAAESCILSPSKNLNEAAQNLFGMMRELDAGGAEIILAEYLPEEGLGRAINDRLMRAASK